MMMIMIVITLVMIMVIILMMIMVIMLMMIVTRMMINQHMDVITWMHIFAVSSRLFIAIAASVTLGDDNMHAVQA